MDEFKVSQFDVFKGKTYHQIFQLDNDFTEEKLRQSYFKLARQLHPDKNNNTELANEQFQFLNYAYEVLKDPILNQKYIRESLFLRYIYKYFHVNSLAELYNIYSHYFFSIDKLIEIFDRHEFVEEICDKVVYENNQFQHEFKAYIDQIILKEAANSIFGQNNFSFWDFDIKVKPTASKPTFEPDSHTTKKRGRPKKQTSSNKSSDETVNNNSTKKRGRPKRPFKDVSSEDSEETMNNNYTKKRGRPKKQMSSNEPSSKKRGRPKKQMSSNEPSSKKRGRPCTSDNTKDHNNSNPKRQYSSEKTNNNDNNDNNNHNNKYKPCKENKKKNSSCSPEDTNHNNSKKHCQQKTPNDTTKPFDESSMRISYPLNENDEICDICQTASADQTLVCCFRCQKSYHHNCMQKSCILPYDLGQLRNDWICVDYAFRCDLFRRSKRIIKPSQPSKNAQTKTNPNEHTDLSDFNTNLKDFIYLSD